jgi:hypothetical protein
MAMKSVLRKEIRPVVITNDGEQKSDVWKAKLVPAV